MYRTPVHPVEAVAVTKHCSHSPEKVALDHKICYHCNQLIYKYGTPVWYHCNTVKPNCNML